MSALEIRPYEEHDEPALAALAAASGAGVLASAAQRAWALQANPAGRRLFVARRAERLLAAFACLPVRTRLGSESRVFAEVHALLPTPREGTPREGTAPELVDDEAGAALLAAARAALEAHAVPQGDLVLYGWPAGGAARLLEQHLEFELLRVSALLVAPLGAAPGDDPRERAGPVRELARFGPELDRLYSCCATHWEASAVRDAAFLAWRFGAHPSRRHALLALPNGDELRGYAVYRAGDELAPGLGLLIDWLVLPGDVGAAEELLQAVQARARADGLTHLAASFPEWSPWSLHFQERGFLHHPGEHRLLVRGSTPRHDMLWLRSAWWSTLADALAM